MFDEDQNNDENQNENQNNDEIPISDEELRKRGLKKSAAWVRTEEADKKSDHAIKKAKQRERLEDSGIVQVSVQAPEKARVTIRKLATALRKSHSRESWDSGAAAIAIKAALCDLAGVDREAESIGKRVLAASPWRRRFVLRLIPAAKPQGSESETGEPS